jgi:hypothetical protein
MPRDEEILLHVYRHRFLDTTHICALISGSEQGINRRLTFLYHNGYLDRVSGRKQQNLWEDRGSNHHIYAIADAGMDVLTQKHGIPRGRRDWEYKNEGVRERHILHTLLVADWMVCLESHAKRLGSIRVVEFSEILAEAPEETRRRLRPYQWKVVVLHNGQPHPITVVPDRIFGLEFLDEPIGHNKAYFFLEADRGTETVRSSNPLKYSSFYRKVIGYHETHKEKVHTGLFGFKQFRVLTVTENEARMYNLIEKSKEIYPGVGSALFYFTIRQAIASCDDVFALQLLNGRGERVTLRD